MRLCKFKCVFNCAAMSVCEEAIVQVSLPFSIGKGDLGAWSFVTLSLAGVGCR